MDVQIAGRAASDDMAQDSSPRDLKRLVRRACDHGPTPNAPREREGSNYRDDSIADHVLRWVSNEVGQAIDASNTYLIRGVVAGCLSLRGGSTLRLGLGLLGRHFEWNESTRKSRLMCVVLLRR